MSTIHLAEGHVDVETREVHGPRHVRLSPTELRLLRHLADRPNVVVSREQLLVDVWNYAPDSRSRTLYATIQRLRAKIEVDPAQPEVLLTIGRVGYSYRPPAARGLEPASIQGWARPLDRFVGRLDERDALVRWLHGEDPAPLNIHGPAGIGKTRLVKQLVIDDGASLRRATFVELSGCVDVADLCRVLSTTVGLPMQTGDRARQRLGRVLAGRGPALLIFDEADGLGRMLLDWLDGWSGVRPRVLVLSRRPLLEHAIALGPLDHTATDGEGLSLFMDRARSRWPLWTPTTAERDASLSVVQQLHGSPLAIELAAASAVVLGPERLLAALKGHPALDALHACIQWTWDRLAPVERHALRVLSVFRGSFGLDAAEAVLAAMGLDVHVLTSLAERALVGLFEQNGRRLRIEPAVHAYAEARLEEDAETRAHAIAAHAACYGELGAAEPMEALIVHGDGRAYRTLSAELPNLLAASERDHGPSGARAGRLACFLLMCDGGNEEAQRRLESLAAREGLPSALSVWLHRVNGEALRRLGRIDDARTALDTALQHATRSAPHRVGSVLHTRGVLEEIHGPPELSGALFHEALEHHRNNGDRFREGLSEGELATLRLRTGRLSEAEQLFKRALARLRGLRCPMSESIYLGNLGVAQLKLQRFAPARESFEAALDIARSLDSRRLEVTNLSNLGLLECEADDLEAARRWFELALQRMEREGDQMEACVTEGNLAVVALRQGRLAEARRRLDLADEGYAVLQLPFHAASSQLVRSALCRAEGHPESQYVQAAATLIEEGQIQGLDPWLDAERGMLALCADDRPAAVAFLDAAQRGAAAGELGPNTDVGRAIEDLRRAL